VYHPDAARAWLQDWAGAEFGIDEDFTTVELTIAGRLEELLSALADNAEPDVWATRPPLQRVFLWRTADGDGVAGGAAIAAELRLGDHTILLATGHLGHDEFVDDEATSGIDAAVEALGQVADLVNETVAGLLAAGRAAPAECVHGDRGLAGRRADPGRGHRRRAPGPRRRPARLPARLVGHQRHRPGQHHRATARDRRDAPELTRHTRAATQPGVTGS
jgi:hypothetical protein